MNSDHKGAAHHGPHGVRWRLIGASGFGLLIILGIGLYFLKDHAEPILRARVIETLTAHFQSKVDLTGFHVGVERGLAVSGTGLRIYGNSDPNIHQAGVQPLISIEEFSFQTGLLTLLRSPTHIHSVQLRGLVLNIPPAGQRQGMRSMGSGGSKVKIVVDWFNCKDAQLVINTNRDDKLPLEFSIEKLKMSDVGPGQPMYFDATLLNPKPVGKISSKGMVGPLRVDEPRDTPVNGTYSFDNADLATIRGIGGILSSKGRYDGQLGHIVIDGQTSTPDFRLNVSGHRVPLNTEFHAVVDGTSGNTFLEPVKAQVLSSSFVARGSVVRLKAKGHEVSLNVVIDNARIEDLLTLGVRTEPPIMTGTVGSTAKLDLPPGGEDVDKRLRLSGDFHIADAHLNNAKTQERIDDLSMRSQGKPKLAAAPGTPDVRSDVSGVFNLSQGLMTFSKLRFEVPGTKVEMSGQYSLDGKTFDFHGKVRLDARLSHMVTGWKSVLLKPVDPFFAKNGAGTEVPIRITGTKSEPHIGLDFGHKNE